MAGDTDFSEPTPETPSRPKLPLILGAAAGVAVLAGAGVGAYQTDIIPGFGRGASVAKKLDQEIAAYTGANAKNFVLSRLKPEQQATVKPLLDKENIDFQYSASHRSVKDGMGVVTLENPSLQFAEANPSAPPPSPGMPPRPEAFGVSAPSLSIARDIKDPQHYRSHMEGKVSFYAVTGGTRAEKFAVAFDDKAGEFHYGPNGVPDRILADIENIKVLDAQGSALVTIGAFKQDYRTTQQNGKTDAALQWSMTNIALGDMAKALLGPTDALSIAIDGAYQGDTLPSPESFKPGQPMPEVHGTLTINRVALALGPTEATVKGSLTANGSLEAPSGNLDLTVTSYARLQPYLARIPGKWEQFLRIATELGGVQGETLHFAIEFHDSFLFTLNGKTMPEVQQIVARASTPPEAASPAAPAISPTPGAPAAVPPAAPTPPAAGAPAGIGAPHP